MSVFLNMAIGIEQELLSGRITLPEAKIRLRVNAEIAEKVELCRKYRKLASLATSAWDDPAEKEAYDAGPEL